MNTGSFIKSMAVLVFVAATPIFLGAAERTTISPTGTWGIDDSKEAEPDLWSAQGWLGEDLLYSRHLLQGLSCLP